MRQLFRLLAPVLAAGAIVLAGATATLAASSPSSSSLDASFCYADGSTQYCYVIDGTIRYLDTKAGSSVTVNEMTRTTLYESGQYVGESFSTSTFRGTFASDGTVVMQSVVNTRSSLGDDPCVYRMVLRLVDYQDAVVYQVTATCA
jgi:hypothetical protein